MMLFEVIARIIRLRKNGQNENALEEIEKEIRENA